MKYFNNRGLTLVEILASVVILSIIAIFLSSILQTTSKQNEAQQTAAKQLTDATFILKVVTKDFRRYPEFREVSDNELLLDPTSTENITYVTKEVNDITLLQKIIVSSSGPKTEIIAENIGCFYVNDIDSKGIKLEIKVSTNPTVQDCKTPHKDIKETTLQLRKGDK